MRISRLHVTTAVVFAALIWSVIRLINGQVPTWADIISFFEIIGPFMLLLIILEFWAWKAKCLKGWFIDRPNIWGSWSVTLKSDWVDPTTGTRVEPIKCYMSIEQSLSQLKMRLLTKESESWLVAHDLSPSIKGDGYQIAGVYNNQPKLTLRDEKSAIHYGSFLLETHGSKIDPESMDGHYWTDRGTKGEISLVRISEKKISRFSDGESLVSHKT